MSSNLVHPPGIDWLKHSGTKLSVRMASLKASRKIIARRSLSMYKLWYRCIPVLWETLKEKTFTNLSFSVTHESYQKKKKKKINFGCVPPTYDWLAFRFSPSKVSRYIIMVLLANALSLMKNHNE